MGRSLSASNVPAHGVGEGHFAGGDQVQRLAFSLLATFFDGKQVFLKLGQLPRAAQGIGIHDVRRVALGVAVLGGLHVQHELGQRAVQAGDGAAHEGKAGTCQLGTRVGIQAQRRAYIDMVFHFKVKLANAAPGAGHHVARLVCAHGHAVVRQVGQLQHHGVQVGHDGGGAQLTRLQLGFVGGYLGHHGIGAFAFGFEHANGFGQAVAFGLQLFGAHLDGFALCVQRVNCVNVQKLSADFCAFAGRRSRRRGLCEGVWCLAWGDCSFTGFLLYCSVR